MKKLIESIIKQQKDGIKIFIATDTRHTPVFSGADFPPLNDQCQIYLTPLSSIYRSKPNAKYTSIKTLDGPALILINADIIIDQDDLDFIKTIVPNYKLLYPYTERSANIKQTIKNLKTSENIYYKLIKQKNINTILILSS